MSVPITHFVDATVALSSGTAEAVSFGLPIGVFTHSITANRVDGPYSSVAEVVAAGFTSGAAADVNAWATAMFSQEIGVDQILIGREDAGDADATETLDAIEAADDSWYLLNTGWTRAEAEILLAAAWTEARTKLYIAQSSDSEILAGDAGNVALDLQTAGYHRTGLIYHDADDEYLDGAWTSRCGGFDLDAEGGVGIWGYKQLSGIDYATVTSAEAGEVFDANANLYHRLKGLSFTSHGTAASGRFLDITTSLDWIKARTEEAILSAFVSAPTKVPYTNAGIAIILSAIYGVLDKGVTAGHLSGDHPRIVSAPKVTDVSTADKTNRVLTLTVECTLAGAIQKVVMTVNVSQ